MSVPSDKGTFSVEARKLTVSREAAITSDDARALTVGAHPLYPALAVDASAAGSATGIRVASAGAGGGAVISVVSSGTDEALVLSGKGISGVTVSGNLHVTGDLEVQGSGGGGGGFLPAIALTGSTTLTAADHGGRLLTLPETTGSSGSYSITLPPLESGLWIRFAVVRPLDSYSVIINTGVAGSLYGTLTTPTSGTSAITAKNGIAVASGIGSSLHFECDGNVWIVTAYGAVQLGMSAFPA